MRHTSVLYKIIHLSILITLLYGCKKPEVAFIQGTLTGPVRDDMIISNPINGFCYLSFKNPVKTDSQGNFKISIPVKKPSLINFYVPEVGSKIILVEPGYTFNIRVFTGNKDKAISISGHNEKGQNLYNSIYDFMYKLNLKNKLRKISSADSIETTIKVLKKTEQAKFKNLYESKEISKSYYRLISTDIDCFYAALLSEVLYSKFIVAVNPMDPKHPYKFSDDLMKLWKKLYADTPLNKRDLIRSNWWYDYAYNFINFKIATSDTFNLEKVQDLYYKGLLHTNNIKTAKQNITGLGLEYFEAAYIYAWSSQKHYEKEFISLYNEFRETFPQSDYSKYLEPKINNIIDFYSAQEQSYSKEIKILDNYDKLNSLSECLNFLQGKKIYLDIWATWCGPCKAQFEYRDSLEKYLSSNQMEPMYISIDKDSRNGLWKEMISYYKLKGYHIRANKSLIQDLKKICNKNDSILIPWYILIGENGNIINMHAPRPSEIVKSKGKID